MTIGFDPTTTSGAADPVRAGGAMRVLILSPNRTVAGRIAATLATDPNISARTHKGALSDLVLAGDMDWETLDFVVFHVEGDGTADMLALRWLRHGRGDALRLVAVVDDGADPARRDRIRAAGADEVLGLASLGRPERPADGRPRRLTLGATAADRAETDADGPAFPTEPAVGPTATPTEANDPATLETPVAITCEAPAALPDLSDVAAPEAAHACHEGAAVRINAATGDGRLTLFLRARGGAGATTLATNLALLLAARGTERVAIVDLDIQNGSAGVQMDLPDSAAFGALLREGRTPDAAFLDAAMVRHDGGVDVLPAPDVMAPLSALSPAQVDALVTALKARYDHVLIDMPQAMPDWIEPVLDRASRAVVVTDTAVPSVKRAQRLIRAIAEEHMTLSVEIVVNREARPLLLSEGQKEAARLLGQPLEHWVPEDPARARRAIDRGEPLVASAPRSRPSRALGRLAAALYPAPRRREGR
ncbi:Septum site-determining protein MinD [Roseivivax jejudonensis]|uniref:Septum site-determining protein MinD n=1 Tax=Roseivivax jejudonensis TaxID=1529041 RepID=A0A1X6ZBK1_9RHOB|nr:AAA family ATPase [Roseivivax jejudonensis]SLN46399.1 Septum site-determining protein MinD [Roseivivax jejudonensis]